jgi:hypothetical protein
VRRTEAVTTGRLKYVSESITVQNIHVGFLGKKRLCHCTLCQMQWMQRRKYAMCPTCDWHQWVQVALYEGTGDTSQFSLETLLVVRVTNTVWEEMLEGVISS